MNDYTGSPDDFAFLEGAWRVAHRRLKTRHARAGSWDEFFGTMRFFRLLDGGANVDEFDCAERNFKGMSVRALNIEERRWAIYWINSITGVLQSPVYGGFKGDKGVFYGDDMDNGRPVKVRFIWTVDSRTPRWEQAFSIDGGARWETNWIMDFSRK